MNTVIETPEGFEKVETTNDDGHTVISFKPITKKVLPQCWEDLGVVEGFYVGKFSDIKFESRPAKENNRSTWPTRELAEACRAMSQLAQLRDVWRDGWVPDWSVDDNKYVIRFMNGCFHVDFFCSLEHFLAFPTEQMRDDFMSAPKIRKLIETAKPLLGG